MPVVTPPESNASSNSDLVAQVIREVITRRAQGERISSAQVMASNPELMPALRGELLALDAIHSTVVLGQTKTTTPIESDPHTGLRIDGYFVEREISSGGQATVFKAVQERTGRVVAVKIMHGGPFMGSRGRKRFDRESKILADLNHPNVVGILDKGRTSDGSFYMVMDFVEGCCLDAYVRKLGKNTSAIVALFAKIACAVDEAHRLGIVHRDLKPMNILVDSRGEPHILDFGMARILPSDGNAFEDNMCPFDKPHLRAGPVNRDHAAHLEVRHGSKDQRGGFLARSARRPEGQRAIDPGLVQGQRLS
jgi:hypothetical protein